jgi:hypothetical protein
MNIRESEMNVVLMVCNWGDFKKCVLSSFI